MTITPRNWEKFQHYHNRKPIWIKLHRSLLDDYEFGCLPVASKALAPLLWLLASEYPGGVIEAELPAIAYRLHMPTTALQQALKPLIEAGFFAASNTLATCYQDASPEKEREEEKEIEIEKEPRSDDRATVLPFPNKPADDWPADYEAQFWNLYPVKKEKKPAMAKLKRVRKEGVSFERIMNGLRLYVATQNPEYFHYPTTWLNRAKWDDEPSSNQFNFRRL